MINILKEPQWFFGFDGKTLPKWFAGYDSYMQLVFFVITLLVALYAFKIYKLSQKKESYQLGVGFLFISVSYFVWAFLNLAIVREIGELLCESVKLCAINLVIDIAIYLHMLLFLMGLLTLTYATLKIESVRTYTLLSVMLLLVILFSLKTLFFFYLLSSVLLLYLVLNNIANYLKKKQHKILIMSTAFFLLFLGNIEFLFGLSGGMYYVIGNILVLVAYLIILLSIISTLRK